MPKPHWNGSKSKKVGREELETEHSAEGFCWDEGRRSQVGEQLEGRWAEAVAARVCATGITEEKGERRCCGRERQCSWGEFPEQAGRWNPVPRAGCCPEWLVGPHAQGGAWRVSQVPAGREMRREPGVCLFSQCVRKQGRG